MNKESGTILDGDQATPNDDKINVTSRIDGPEEVELLRKIYNAWCSYLLK